jgi:hypothetical protein
MDNSASTSVYETEVYASLFGSFCQISCIRVHRNYVLAILTYNRSTEIRATFQGPSDTIGNHVESYVNFKSLKISIGVEILYSVGMVERRGTNASPPSK